MAVGQGSSTLAIALRGLNTTTRQVQHWTAKGFIKTRGETGTGYTTEYPQEELKVLRVMARLVEVGMTAFAAAKIARTAVEQGASIITLPHDIRIVIDPNG